MPIRDQNWLRRNTTVQDLLDDGVENFSDLDQLPSQEPQAMVEPAVLQIRSDTIARVKAEEYAQERSARRRNFSLFGACLGMLIALSGGLLIAFPADMRVEHSRIKYLPSVTEDVTPARSRLYGAAALAFGTALLAYSLYRPRP
jgi:hypothetical protein